MRPKSTNKIEEWGKISKFFFLGGLKQKMICFKCMNNERFRLCDVGFGWLRRRDERGGRN